MGKPEVVWGKDKYLGMVWNGKNWVQPTPEQLAERQKEPEAQVTTRVTTLPTVPGYRIVNSLGIVSVVAASSGLTAGMKGNDALVMANQQLLAQALKRGANAVVGVTGSAFGAAGGITSAFGGDAVGILLLGTAVTVEPEDHPTAEASA